MCLCGVMSVSLSRWLCMFNSFSICFYTFFFFWRVLLVLISKIKWRKSLWTSTFTDFFVTVQEIKLTQKNSYTASLCLTVTHFALCFMLDTRIDTWIKMWADYAGFYGYCQKKNSFEAKKNYLPRNASLREIYIYVYKP